MDLEPEQSDDSPIEISLEGEFLSPGEKFGDYQVMNCLSFDLLGGVYRMQNIFQFNEVCMTVLHSEASQVPGFDELLKQQVKILNGLNHPNILKVVGATSIKNRCCLIMEPIEGENICDYLRAFIKQQQQLSGAPTGEMMADSPHGKAEDSFRDFAFGLPVAHAVDIIKQITNAFKAAHTAEIQHNVFNPTSLIRASDGSIKVSGFGLFNLTNRELLQKLSSAEITPFTMGLRKVRINTAKYLPPEIYRGEKPAPSSDIYSIGTAAFYLLSGHKPVGTSAKENTDYKPPSQYSPAIPGGWDKLIGACLDPEPENRLTNPRAFLNGIEKIAREKAKAREDKKSIAQQIERVPVPRAFVKKLDPEKLKIVRLGIIGIFATLVIAAGSFCYQIIFEDEEKAAGPVVKRVVEGQEPLYSLTISPPKSRVVFSGKGKGESSFVVPNGLLAVTMPRGEYEVKASATDHQPKTETIEVGGELIESSLTLEPFWSLLEIKADPGVHVVAIRESGDRIDLGQVPANGLLRAERMLYKGIYTIEASLPNYKTSILSDIDLPFKKLVSQEVVLEPMLGKMIVLTQPEGAEVILDGTAMGTTPLTLEDLGVGEPISLELILENYRPEKLNLTLPPGYDDTLDLGTLQRKAGTLKVELSFQGKEVTPDKLAAVKYRVAGKSYEEVTGTLEEVYEGSQTLEVEHPDYFVWSQRLQVVDGRTSTIAVELAPRPGLLNVKLDVPLPFSIVANGSTAPKKEESFEIPAERKVEVEVQIKDHLTVKREMRFAANEKQTWEVKAVLIPSPEKSKDWVIPYLGATMAWISPGEVRLGSPPPEQARLPNEGPRTTVVLPHGYWMSHYEISQREYQQIMEENPSEFKGQKRPVEHVTWQQAMEFCRRITQIEQSAGRLPANYSYRLPTEAEWEYACRAGTETPYSFGPNADHKLGNFKGGYPREHEARFVVEDEKYGTVPVGSYKANSWGLFDMHGNVGEWCWDNFNSRYPGGTEEEWSGPSDGESKVYRGGGWGSFAHQCRSAARQRLRPGTASNLVGFRFVLARNLEP